MGNSGAVPKANESAWKSSMAYGGRGDEAHVRRPGATQTELGFDTGNDEVRAAVRCIALVKPIWHSPGWLAMYRKSDSNPFRRMHPTCGASAEITYKVW